MIEIKMKKIEKVLFNDEGEERICNHATLVEVPFSISTITSVNANTAVGCTPFRMGC